MGNSSSQVESKIEKAKTFLDNTKTKIKPTLTYVKDKGNGYKGKIGDISKNLPTLVKGLSLKRKDKITQLNIEQAITSSFGLIVENGNVINLKNNSKIPLKIIIENQETNPLGIYRSD